MEDQGAPLFTKPRSIHRNRIILIVFSERWARRSWSHSPRPKRHLLQLLPLNQKKPPKMLALAQNMKLQLKVKVSSKTQKVRPQTIVLLYSENKFCDLSDSSLVADLCFLLVTSSSLHCDWLRQLLYRRLRRIEITAVNSSKLISVNGGDVGDNADAYDGGGGGSDAVNLFSSFLLLVTKTALVK